MDWMKKVGWVVCVSIYSSAWAAGPDLDPKPIFAYEDYAESLVAIYAGVEGASLKEKARNAMTTVDMKAVAAMQLYEKEKELARVGLELWSILPAAIMNGSENPKERFLSTHQAWRIYIKEQSMFIANTTGGGSGYGLEYTSVLMREIEWRTRLYQDLLDGKNAVKNELYFYSCPCPSDD